jgi:tRNA(Ile)-lysidine synthetase-like protein
MKNILVSVVENKNLFNKNEPIVLALSGGVDSMVLFDILLQLDVKVILAHVNHNKRKESLDEFNYIKKLAYEKKVPFEGFSLKANEHTNFHHDARLRRYSFFRAIAQKHNAKKIVVAHHLDDQVETVLMRIVRGTSFQGYSGIKPIRLDRNVSIVRPLMDVKKDEILLYAKENNITYFEDSSNKEDIYTRNRFRNQIIPLLQEENPNLESKILQLAEYIDGADEILETIKREFLHKHSMYNNINLTEFNLLNRVVKIKVLEHIINSTSDNSVEVSYEQYKTLIEICSSVTPNQEYSLGNGYLFKKEYDVIYIEKEKDIKPIHITINSYKEYFVDDNKSFIVSKEKLGHYDSNYFELCYNKLEFPLYIRQRQDGDKMRLKIGTKKVKDILIDQKIPKSKRDTLLVIANDEEVLWIPNIKKSYQDPNLEKKLYIYEVN